MDPAERRTFDVVELPQVRVSLPSVHKCTDNVVGDCLTACIALFAYTGDPTRLNAGFFVGAGAHLASWPRPA